MKLIVAALTIFFVSLLTYHQSAGQHIANRKSRNVREFKHTSRLEPPSYNVSDDDEYYDEDEKELDGVQSQEQEEEIADYDDEDENEPMSDEQEEHVEDKNHIEEEDEADESDEDNEEEGEIGYDVHIIQNNNFLRSIFDML